ncbi:MAG: AraC family transcriptional regulator [Myxococcota bacterium]
MSTQFVETNSSAMLRVVAQALHDQGADMDRELQRVGMSADDITARDHRIARSAYVALWQRLVEISGDPDCGLHLAEQKRHGVMGVLEYACASASTVAHGLQRLASYGRLLHDCGSYEFHRDDRHGRFVYRASKRTPAPRAAIDWSFTYLFLASRRAAGEEFSAQRVRVQYAAPSTPSELARIFGCPVEYECDISELLLDREIIDLPLATADPALARLMDQFAEDHLTSLPGIDTFADVLRRAIAERITDDGPAPLADVARALGMSSRSMQRQLRDRGETFQRVTTEVRMNAAAEHLKDSQLAISEIAFKLGYSQVSAFHRAFRRWFECTPVAYRQRHLQAERDRPGALGRGLDLGRHASDLERLQRSRPAPMAMAAMASSA